MFVERSILVTAHLQAPVHRLLTPLAPGLHPSTSLKFQMLSLLSLLPLASISAPGGSYIISKSIQLEVLRRSYKLERNLTTVDGRIRLVKLKERKRERKKVRPPTKHFTPQARPSSKSMRPLESAFQSYTLMVLILYYHVPSVLPRYLVFHHHNDKTL